MDARMNENFRNILFVMAMGVLYCIDAIAIQTNLSIAISNRLTINWMVLLKTNQTQKKSYESHNWFFKSEEERHMKWNACNYRCLFTAAHNMKWFCQQHPGYAYKCGKNKKHL